MSQPKLSKESMKENAERMAQHLIDDAARAGVKLGVVLVLFDPTEPHKMVTATTCKESEVASILDIARQRGGRGGLILPPGVA